MLTVIKDKELIWDIDNYDVILVGTSVYSKLDAGFQSKMKFKFPILDEKNDKMPYGDLRRLGTRLTFEELTPIVSLLYICGYPTRRYVTLNYDALENCLKTANNEFKGKKVATTLLGASLHDGNGDRGKCLKILEDSSTDIDLYVYDYVQLSRQEEISRQKKYINTFKLTDYKKYQQLKEKEEEILKQLYLK